MKWKGGRTMVFFLTFLFPRFRGRRPIRLLFSFSDIAPFIISIIFCFSFTTFFQWLFKFSFAFIAFFMLSTILCFSFIIFFQLLIIVFFIRTMGYCGSTDGVLTLFCSYPIVFCMSSFSTSAWFGSNIGCSTLAPLAVTSLYKQMNNVNCTIQM